MVEFKLYFLTFTIHMNKTKHVENHTKFTDLLLCKYKYLILPNYCHNLTNNVLNLKCYTNFTEKRKCHLIKYVLVVDINLYVQLPTIIIAKFCQFFLKDTTLVSDVNYLHNNRMTSKTTKPS